MVAYIGNLPKPKRLMQSSNEIDKHSPAKMREKAHHQRVMKRRRKRRAAYQGEPPEHFPPPAGPPGDE